MNEGTNEVVVTEATPRARVVDAMTANAKQVLDAALDLDAHERRQVAQALLDSVDESKQAELDGAWRDEVLRRMEQVKAGEVELETWDEVRRLGREALAQR